MDVALLVLDGWGIREGATGRNAVADADTPTFDRIVREGAYGTLSASGKAVGLPAGRMGNSEVGHLTIGAGRIVKQAFTRIEDAVVDGSFRDNEAIRAAFDSARVSGGRVHFMGLVSDGGVHSHHHHLHALIELAADLGVEAVTHAFTDGRDTDPTGGAEFLADLESVVTEHGTGAVATVSGRYYAMDRDENWERTGRAYDAIVDREANHVATDPVAAIESAYDRGETDEFVEPTLVEDKPGLSADDAVVFFNFRADRVRQLVRMLADIDPEWPFETDPPAVSLTTMTEYDREFPLPVAFPPVEPTDTLGELLAEAGLTQLRIAESEKYAHVTYFLNGGREVAFDGERREIVPSPDVPTYDRTPAMSAPDVTERAIEVIEAEGPNALVLNYANPDMVGHTGDYEATKDAVEAVDQELGRLLTAIATHDAHAIVIADHGNADDMGTADDPHTAHTTSPVPFVYLAPDGDPNQDTEGTSVDRSGGYRVRDGGGLADVTPTLLDLLGIDQPEAMTGETLLT